VPVRGRFPWDWGGDNLNEHLFGVRLAGPRVRHERLSEANPGSHPAPVPGEYVNFKRRHFEVERAMLVRPATLRAIGVAASGTESAQLAAAPVRGPDRDRARTRPLTRPSTRPSGGQPNTPAGDRYDPDREAPRALARRSCALAFSAACPGELPGPARSRNAASRPSLGDIAGLVPCGPDPGGALEGGQEVHERASPPGPDPGRGESAGPFLAWAAGHLLPSCDAAADRAGRPEGTSRSARARRPGDDLD